jgi:hypothetical protein
MLKTVYNELKKTHHDRLEEVFQQKAELFELLNTESLPIIIQVNNLTPSAFEGSPLFEFKEMQELLVSSADHLEWELMRYDFILKKPIDYSDLIIHYP